MNVTLPLWMVLAVVVWLAWRYMGLRAWHAVVCLLFGFFLAATSAAPEIRRVVTTVLQSVTNTHP